MARRLRRRTTAEAHRGAPRRPRMTRATVEACKRPVALVALPCLAVTCISAPELRRRSQLLPPRLATVRRNGHPRAPSLQRARCGRAHGVRCCRCELIERAKQGRGFRALSLLRVDRPSDISGALCRRRGPARGQRTCAARAGAQGRNVFHLCSRAQSAGAKDSLWNLGSRYNLLPAARCPLPAARCPLR